MRARLGTALSNKVQMSRGLPQGALESHGHFQNNHGAGPETGDDFVLAAMYNADGVVLAAASVAAAEMMVAEVIAKTESCGFDSWCRGNTLDEPSEDDGHKHWSGRVGCARFEFIMVPKEVALEHCEVDNVAGFSVELERLDDGESHRDKISGWSARVVANVNGVKRPPWMAMDQW